MRYSKIVIEFETTNATFGEGGFFGFSGQIHAILKQAEKKLFDRFTSKAEADDKLLDFNGNVVGIVRIEP